MGRCAIQIDTSVIGPVIATAGIAVIPVIIASIINSLNYIVYDVVVVDKIVRRSIKTDAITHVRDCVTNDIVPIGIIEKDAPIIVQNNVTFDVVPNRILDANTSGIQGNIIFCDGIEIAKVKYDTI